MGDFDLLNGFTTDVITSHLRSNINVIITHVFSRSSAEARDRYTHLDMHAVCISIMLLILRLLLCRAIDRLKCLCPFSQ